MDVNTIKYENALHSLLEEANGKELVNDFSDLLFGYMTYMSGEEMPIPKSQVYTLHCMCRFFNKLK